MNNTKIELRKVGKIRNGAIILKDINLKFTSGKRHILVGPSGAGKTTLLRLLNRMDDPSSGEIIYDGKTIKDIPVLELRRKVGMVFQIPVTFDGTVKDNLMVPYRLKVIPDPLDEGELQKALELSGLQIEFLERKASELSVGEKQRLNVARALINKPEVLLLDEPTSALDPESAMKLLHSIKGLNELLGLTVIMVTHQTDQARLFGGRVIYIENGIVVENREAEEFFENSKGLYK
jgi:putative ABC transport system ATP-binding protein